jgi:acyl carrier protein
MPPAWRFAMIPVVRSAIAFDGGRRHPRAGCRARCKRSGRDLHSTPSVSQQSPFEAEVAALIAQAVNLPSAPETIDPDAALFGAGLGLDSIDLLEIALAVTQRYGCELRSDDPDNARIFASLRNLAAHIAERRRS